MRRFLLAVLLLVSLAPALPAQRTDSLLTVERVFRDNAFAGARPPELQWLPSGSAYFEARPDSAGGTDILRVDLPSGRERILVPAERLVSDSGRRIDVEALSLSADGTRALLFYNSVRVWRQNTRGVYSVLDLATGRLTPVSTRPGLQMFATFSPDGRQVGFVRDNNLFVTDLATGRERQLTTDGSNVIINGTTDWVYEEELDLRNAFRWSPDSRRIAFWRFDQSAVPRFPLVNQLPLDPRIIEMRYPQAGDPNSSVRLGVIATDGSSPATWLEVGPDTGIYLARMDWLGTDSLVIQRLPRLQNRIDVLVASATTGRTRTLLTERSDTWVNVGDQPRWVDGGRRFLWPSERSGWRRYYLFDRSGALVRPVTADSVDALSIDGVDERAGAIYVTEAAPTPLQRQLYRYRLTAGAPSRIRLTREQGTHSISIAPAGRYAVDYYSSAALPPTVTIRDLPSLRARRVLVTNDTLRRRLARLALRPPEFFKVTGAAGDTLNAYRILPPNFDSTKRYPVLMYVYGGPESQTVLDAWGGDRYLWHQILAQLGYVVVSVDNRGTGARNRAFETTTYLDLGTKESDDQIAVARWLAQQPWVDGRRIGIWGWSYGGYMAALTSGRGGDVFRAAISVAPVTDWRLYDSIYTERYMRTPADNPEGYTRSSAQRYVPGLTARLLVVHGTGDDNVHPQNTIQLVNQLEDAGKQFEMMLYPNRTHSISGGNTRAHLFTLLTSFVQDNL